MLEAVPAHVKRITLRHNHFFETKTHAEIDAFLCALGNTRHRLDLSHNESSEFSRTVVPLAQMSVKATFIATSRSRPKRNIGLPQDIIAVIASFLNPSAQAYKALSNVSLRAEQAANPPSGAILNRGAL